MPSSRLFRLSAGLLAWTSVGYPLVLAAAARKGEARRGSFDGSEESDGGGLPTVALIIPAHAEVKCPAFSNE